MTTLPLHPALVHVPLGLAFALPFVTAGLAIALWRGLVPRRAWMVAIALQAMVVAAGVLALRSGEREEDRVARVVGKPPIEAHEEAAEAFVWGAGFVLAVTVAGLLVPATAVAAVAAVATAGTLAVAVLGYRAGEAGGELVYVRGAASAYVPASARDPLVSEHRPRHHRD